MPYSVYGIGELAPTGFSRNIAMGKTGYALSSLNGLNNVNPASYHTIDSISFFFDVGISGDHVKYRTTHDSQKANDGNIRNLALGFSIKPWWKSSIGLVPFSTVGYQIETEKNVEGTIENFNIAMNGSGGLNKFYWGNTFTLFKKIHAGINVNYLFGTIENQEIAEYDKFSGSIITNETSYLNNISTDFGLQVNILQLEKFEFTLGGVYGYKLPLYFNKELTITDEENIPIQEETIYTGKFWFPMNYGAGFSFLLYNKLLVTTDYGFYNWNKTNTQSSDYKYVDTENIRFGIEFLPSQRLNSNYLERITYRAGYYIEDSYLEINNQTTQDIGFTCGISLPIPKNRSSVNLSFVQGKYGTTNKGLIEKKYSSVFISFTLHDWWFIKSKFD